MVTPRISYAHLLATPNPKHVDSLLSFFENGRAQRGTGGFGVEIEHLPVHNADDTAVSYYEPNGVETLLLRLRPYYDESKEYWENGHLVGLARDGVSVSLEPGGQVETSIGILHTPEDLNALYSRFRQEADPIVAELGWRFVAYGYQPKSSFADIPVNPKDRYDAMTSYLGRVGQFGPCMMRCSASTQVSIDFVDEHDAIAKMRIGTAIGPILAWYFRNSPYFEGRINPYPLLRQRMWDYLDFQRTNVIPGLFDQRFGWEDYAIDVLSTPLMFADLTHTPEALESGATAKELHRAAFYENAGDVYPDRELNSYEINHIISTHFNDVRLKNFIELRHWDSLPVERAERLTEIVASLFYVPANRIRLESYFDGLREEDVLEAKANIQARGRDASPYGQPLDFWQEFLGIEGILVDVPGDPAHPDVFQA
ncbi:gamma-glutamylcysteine synthetase [Bifidobacterium lemurum]|uniref:Glutamate--cysteine ligase n=1 Tax=Bifidobacterium lemurum TaxID=1603886 RepID=A0A261FUD5_9BIFI|nr:glutamate-cysteine ligase family protein [Bifidobacterium lemurum]OZG62738.1 gamma-glutamylcysteine synthetase [Bifidobacterium lemurum]QOL34550.1 gamma-glutamylcysteine synthetase [Bifidobacterium lemurum]